LTHVPDVKDRSKRKIGDTYRTVLRTFPGMSWVYAVEANPGTDGHHSHGFLCFRDQVPHQKQLERRFAAAKAGLGMRVAVDSIPDDTDVPHFAYPWKELGTSELAPAFIAINGRFLYSKSWGYWRDARSGAPIAPTKAAAITRARRLTSGT